MHSLNYVQTLGIFNCPRRQGFGLHMRLLMHLCHIYKASTLRDVAVMIEIRRLQNTGGYQLVRIKGGRLLESEELVGPTFLAMSGIGHCYVVCVVNRINTKRVHYNDVIMSLIASQITSLTIVYSTVYSEIKENIKAQRHWPLCGEFTGDRWIPRTKGQ